MQTRQPPSPAVEPKNEHRAAHVLDPDHGEELAGLLVDDALEHQQVGMRLGGDALRDRMIVGNASDVAVCTAGAVGSGCASTNRAIR